MHRILFFFFLLFLFSDALKAQDFDYGTTITQAELDMKQYDKDTSAHALILNEHGTAKIQQVSNNTINIVYEYHVKIKIFDNVGYTWATRIISLSNNDNERETLEAVRGVTTYTDDDGSVKKESLDPDKVYKTDVNKYWKQAKFAMPGVRKGCVIEFDYITYSPFLAHFPKWEFQSAIPKLYSEYEVHLPGFWTYNIALRGPLNLSKQKANIEKDCFSAYGKSCDCAYAVYGMKDIPAFVSEADMTSPLNFISALNFQLTQFTNINTGVVTSFAKEWKDVDYDLKNSDTFGEQLRKKNLFKEVMPGLIAGKTDSIEKAKAIYEYIQKNIKWNNFYGTGSVNGLRKIIEAHTGSCADVNLALVAALNEGGLMAEPVLISTRDHGVVNKLYPVTEGFNYVIAKVDIGGQSYLLDGTDPLLPFGVLPLRCLNDEGRVMNLDKPSYWLPISTGQDKVVNFTLDLTLTVDGKLKGTFIRNSVGYSAYERRKAIKKFNSIAEFVENINAESSRFQFLNSTITNLDSLDQPLIEKYEIEISEYKSMYSQQLNFNQFMLDNIYINPYRLTKRTYPIDKGMPSLERFSYTVHLPDNFVVVPPTALIDVRLPDDGGKFESFFQQDDGNAFTFSHILLFNKAIYAPEEYSVLKEFFNKIILYQKTPLVLKKRE
jgi:hypothetical protein